MKVEKIIVMGDSAINIIGMYEIKLLEVCGKDSTQYRNSMNHFNEMLQEIADDAFKLGMEQGHGS